MMEIGKFQNQKKQLQLSGSSACVQSVHVCVRAFTVKQVLEHVAAIITTAHGHCKGPAVSCT